MKDDSINRLLKMCHLFGTFSCIAILQPTWPHAQPDETVPHWVGDLAPGSPKYHRPHPIFLRGKNIPQKSPYNSGCF